MASDIPLEETIGEPCRSWSWWRLRSCRSAVFQASQQDRLTSPWVRPSALKRSGETMRGETTNEAAISIAEERRGADVLRRAHRLLDRARKGAARTQERALGDPAGRSGRTRRIAAVPPRRGLRRGVGP